jgi:hypothetical protein
VGGDAWRIGMIQNIASQNIAGGTGFLPVPLFRRAGKRFALGAGNPASRGDISSPYHARHALVAENALQLENSGIGSVAAQPHRRQAA